MVPDSLQPPATDSRPPHILVNRAGIIEQVNAECEALFGYAAAELIGQPIELLVPEATRERPVGLGGGFLASEAAGENAPMRRTVLAAHKGGASFPVEIDVRPMPSGQELKFSASIHPRNSTHAAEVPARLQGVAEHAIPAQGFAGHAAEARADRLSSILQNVPAIVYRLEPEKDSYRFTFLSPGVESLLGISPEEAIRNSGLVFSRILPEDREASLRSLLQAEKAGRTQWEYELRTQDAHGRVRWNRLDASMKKGSDGRTVWDGYAYDITEHKALELVVQRKMREERMLVDHTATALALFRNRAIVHVNPAMEQLFDYASGELAGKPIGVLFSSAFGYRQFAALVESQLRTGLPATHKFEFARKNGDHFRALALGRLTDEPSEEIVVSFTDVTALEESTRAIQDAKEAADNASRMKDSYLATISHEVRTPMHAVLGMLELLDHSPLTQEQREMIRATRDSAQFLMRLINDILDLSKIEAGRMEIRPERISLRSILAGTVGLYTELAESKGLRMKVDVDPRLAMTHLADSVRIGQVLGNLLDNALKFTERGGVTVGLELAEMCTEAQDVRFTVSDTGMGIADEDRKKLFTPFTQVGSKGAGGTGLGLSICARLVEAMGGRIGIKSTVGKGTAVSFTLRLPFVLSMGTQSGRCDEPAIDPPAKPAALPRALNAHVLIAEDHPLNVSLIQKQLTLLGYSNAVAGDGVEALERWKSGRYGVLLTDVHMPRMDGYELARAIRSAEAERPGAHRTPIVVFTADALEDLCKDSGVDVCLVKPISLETLRRTLAVWLSVERPERTADTAGEAEPDSRLSIQSTLAEFTGGDVNAEREVISAYLAANEADLARLRKALELDNIELIVQSAHRIKGASRMIGANDLAEAAEQLERCGKQGQQGRIHALAAQFFREIDRLTAYLSDRLKNLG